MLCYFSLPTLFNNSILMEIKYSSTANKFQIKKIYLHLHSELHFDRNRKFYKFNKNRYRIISKPRGYIFNFSITIEHRNNILFKLDTKPYTWHRLSESFPFTIWHRLSESFLYKKSSTSKTSFFLILYGYYFLFLFITFCFFFLLFRFCLGLCLIICYI